MKEVRVGGVVPAFQIRRRLQCEQCAGMGLYMLTRPLSHKRDTVTCEFCAGKGTPPIPVEELGMYHGSN